MNFSRRQMQRECAAEMRVIRTLLLSLFAAAVTLIWVLYAGKKDHLPADIGYFLCLSLAAGGVVMGMILILTGEEWLIRHSPYGQSLAEMGDARELMRRIDAEAAEGGEYAHVRLLKSWLILYYESPTAKDPHRVCASPIPAEKLDCLSFSREGKAGVRMRAMGKDRVFGSVLIFDQEEGRAILQWSKAQEIKTEWIK